MKTRKLYFSALFISFIFIQGCSPEVGTVAWCEKMEDTPKNEWNLEQSREYAISCFVDRKG